MTIRRIRRFAAGATTLGAALTLAACGRSLVPSVPQSAGAPATQPSIVHTAVYDAWRTSLMRTAFPGDGCFKVSFPSTAWVRAACATPPNLVFWNPARHGIRPDNVGDGTDFVAETTNDKDKISSAVGSFPTIAGVKTEKSVGGEGGLLGTNSYSLQLNSNFFSSLTCKDAHLPSCLGWEQFVYENPPNSSQSYLYIQYWLIHEGQPFTHCPSQHNWHLLNGYCYTNSRRAVTLPNQPITNLANVSETGNADLSGDSIYISTGTDMYGMKVKNGPITDLANDWLRSEFNVFGDGGGSTAKFNSGSTVTTSIEINDGLSTAPSCPADSGTTAEGNTLSFVRAPAHGSQLKFPSVLFTESNVRGGGRASCDTLEGSGH